jgi:hypothetical protein
VGLENSATHSDLGTCPSRALPWCVKSTAFSGQGSISEPVQVGCRIDRGLWLGTRIANSVSELGRQRLRTVPVLAARVSGPRLERHPATVTEWRPDMRDRDFDDPQWINPAFPHHRDLPKLTRAVRDELRRTADRIGQALDAIETHPWRR